jgi:hypothetical protein
MSPLKFVSKEDTDGESIVAIANYEQRWQRFFPLYATRFRNNATDNIYYDPLTLRWLKTSMVLTTVAILLIPVVLFFTMSLSRTHLLVIILVSVFLFACALSASARLKPFEILISLAT